MYKLFSFFIFFIILACSRDKYDKPAPVPEETAQTWIERKVREHYYWYQDIPPSEQLDFSIPFLGWKNIRIPKPIKETEPPTDWNS